MGRLLAAMRRLEDAVPFFAPADNLTRAGVPLDVMHNLRYV
jgi:hypothetical protein